MKIEKQTQKPLLSREEFTATVTQKTTPSNAMMKEAVSKQFGKEAELVVIKKIRQKYGQDEAEVSFYVYDNQEALKKFEREKKVKKVAGAAAPGTVAGA